MSRRSRRLSGAMMLLQVFENLDKLPEDIDKVGFRFEIEPKTGKVTQEMCGPAGMMLYGVADVLVKMAEKAGVKAEDIIDDLEDMITAVEFSYEVEARELAKDDELTVKFNQ